MVIEFLCDLFKAQDLAVVGTVPSKESNIVEKCFGNKALLDKALECNGLTASLGKLLVVFVCDERKVDILGLLPTEGLVEKCVFGC